MFQHPTFKWSVEHDHQNFSQAYVVHLIENVYPQCQPFQHLSTEVIALQEEIENNQTPETKTNPQYLQPAYNQRDYYNQRFGEGRFEERFGAIEVTLNPQATAWHWDSFSYGNTPVPHTA